MKLLGRVPLLKGEASEGQSRDAAVAAGLACVRRGELLVLKAALFFLFLVLAVGALLSEDRL